MCSGAIQRDPESGVIGFRHGPTGEIAGISESREDFYKRVAKKRQAEVDAQAAKRNALMAQQQAESQRLQAQMAKQQKAQTKKVAGLESQQAERIAGVRSRGQSAVSSLQILGQTQPTAPTASQTANSRSRRGAGSTQTSISRGSTRGRGPNLSI